MRTRGDQYMGIAIFSTWPIIDQGTIQFPDELNNLCLWADIVVQADTIRVYTAHLASLRFGDQDYEFIRHFELRSGSDSLPRQVLGSWAVLRMPSSAVRAKSGRSRRTWQGALGRWYTAAI